MSGRALSRGLSGAVGPKQRPVCWETSGFGSSRGVRGDRRGDETTGSVNRV